MALVRDSHLRGDANSVSTDGKDKGFPHLARTRQSPPGSLFYRVQKLSHALRNSIGGGAPMLLSGGARMRACYLKSEVSAVYLSDPDEQVQPAAREALGAKFAPSLCAGHAQFS